MKMLFFKKQVVLLIIGEKKTIDGLVLMPATRHNFLHLNKCARIKDKLQKEMKKSNRQAQQTEIR